MTKIKNYLDILLLTRYNNLLFLIFRSDIMQYKLVMKNGNNNYQPFDFELLDSYNNENLNDLKGIDEFTSNYDDDLQLKYDLFAANFIEYSDLDKPFKIIYYENSRIRESKYGLSFKNSKDYLDSDKIIEFLNNNITNPLVLNKIYNEFQNKEQKSPALIIVLNVLKNVRKAENLKNIYYVKFLPYEEIRNLGLYIFRELCDIIYIKDGDGNGTRKLLSNEKN